MDAQPLAHTGFQRKAFLRGLSRLISEWGAGAPAEIEGRLDEALAEVGDEALAGLLERLSTTGGDWGYHSCDPVAQRISRLAHSLILLPGSGIDGAENLAVARERPVIFLGNHLSFADANTVDALLSAGGFADLTVQLCVVVGPKVFMEPLRRLASLCFGTIKIPQSASRASGEAVMGIRDVARLAASTLRSVRERQALGDHLLIFVEGTRSRTGGMQPVLTAVGRYVEHPGALVIPFGIWGTEELVPIGDERVHPARVRVRFGEPIEGATLRERTANRSELAEAIGRSIARLLPPAYRGVYAQP